MSDAKRRQDYSAVRWSKEPFSSVPLETLNVNAIVPVDLNSILYRNYQLLSQMYNLSGATQNSSKSSDWGSRASDLRTAVIAVCWNDTLASFYDFNTTAGAQHAVWSNSGLYPYWAELIPGV